MADRRERVILDLDDRFSPGAARAAAAASVLEKETNKSGSAMRNLTRDSGVAGREVDKLSGRMRIMADAAALLGPAIAPIGAAAVPALVGLTNQMGFAAVAAGTAVLALHGVGDALKSMNEYGAEPTTQNLEKMQDAMNKLAPAGRDFVRTLHDIEPQLKTLQSAAQAGLLPGATVGITALMDRLPQVRRIVAEVSTALGDLLAEGGKTLAGPEWSGWFDRIASEARPALMDLGHTIGNLAAGFAHLWETFLPISHDFSSGLLDMSRSFEQWSANLGKSQGFADFLSYVETSGPKVLDTLGALGNALVQLLQAMAPLGGVSLGIIRGFAEAIGAIANSDIGTPIFAGLAAMTLFNRAMQASVGLRKSLNAASMSSGPLSVMASQVGMAGKLSGAYRLEAMAQKELTAVTNAQTVARERAIMAQNALIPRASKVAAIRDYQAATQSVATAESKLSLAQQRIAGTQRQRNIGFAKGAAGAAGLALALSPLPEKLGAGNTASLALMGTLAGPWGAAIGAATGFALDFAHANDKVEDAIKRAHAAAASGDPEQISAAQGALQAQASHLATASRWSLKANFERTSTFLTGGNGDMLRASRELASAQGKITDEANRAHAALTSTYGSNIAATATQSLSEFKAALQSVNDLLSGRASMRAYQAALDDATTAVRKNGRTLDINTAKGRENQAALDAIASSAIAVAEKMNGLQKARALERARKDFINTATSMGMPLAQAQRLADKLFRLGKIHVTPSVKVVDEASGVIGAIQSRLTTLRDKDITIRTFYTSSGKPLASGTGSPDSAFGNIFHFANGDIANGHQPELAGPGMTRVWREPETQGEAYIPLANDGRRPRAQAIAAETVRLLGGVAQFATGGVTKKHHNYFTPNEYASAVNSFELSGADLATATKELRQFAATIRRDGGSVGRNFAVLSRRIETTAKSFQSAKAKLDNLRSLQSDARSAAVGSFNHDPFGGSLQDFVTQTSADRNDAKAMNAAIKRAQSHGLSGPLAAALAGSGNLALAQQFAGASKTQIGSYEYLYAQRTQQQNALGSTAAGVFTKQIVAQTNVLHKLNQRLNTLEGAVERGARHGISERSKGAANRKRVGK